MSPMAALWMGPPVARDWVLDPVVRDLGSYHHLPADLGRHSRSSILLSDRTDPMYRGTD